MDYLYYIEIIDVFMYGGEKEQKGHKEKKPTEFGKPLFFWHLMWAKTVGTAQTLQK